MRVVTKKIHLRFEQIINHEGVREGDGDGEDRESCTDMTSECRDQLW